jgi:hypothetical protein
VTGEANADQKIAHGTVVESKRSRFGRGDQRTYRGQVRVDGIGREALAVRGDFTVKPAKGQAGLGDDGHIVGFVGDNAIYLRERDAKIHGDGSKITERSSRAQWSHGDLIGLAFAHELGDFRGAGGLND